MQTRVFRGTCGPDQICADPPPSRRSIRPGEFFAEEKITALVSTKVLNFVGYEFCRLSSSREENSELLHGGAAACFEAKWENSVILGCQCGRIGAESLKCRARIDELGSRGKMGSQNNSNGGFQRFHDDKTACFLVQFEVVGVSTLTR